MSQLIDDDDETYAYEVLQEKDCVECAAFLAETFTKNNPYEIHMKTPYEQFYADALSLCTSIVATNLSLIARHKQSKEIHGIVQGADAKTFNPEEASADVEHSADRTPDPIIPLMLQSEDEYMKVYEQKFGELQQNSVVHILMAGVRSDRHGCGLGTKLHRVFLDNARRRGFKQVIVDASSPAIHHIYTKKLNGKVFKSIDLSTYVTKNDNGDDYRPFERLNVEYTFIVIDL